MPDDVRPALDGRHELVRSMETTDSRLAEKRRDDVWREWDTAIAEARRRTVAEITLPRLLREIDDWRRRRCVAAATSGAEPARALRDTVLLVIDSLRPLHELGAVGLYGEELDHSSAPLSLRRGLPSSNVTRTPRATSPCRTARS